MQIYGDVTYEFYKENKKMIFEKNSFDGRVIFNDMEISGWEISFIDKSETLNLNSDLKSFNGLTGCLNFIDSRLNNVNIRVDKSKCEDALNLIRSKGTINNIYISNSISDGLDADFSKLKIKNLNSVNSENDLQIFLMENMK